jgi:hypothetical protein
MAPKSTPSKLSEPSSERTFKILHDEAGAAMPRRFATTSSNAGFDGPNNENFDPSCDAHSRSVFKFVNKPSTQPHSVSTVQRTPLADVTQMKIGRPRSLSAALAEIARLKDELELSKDKNSKLKGEIVAYQDALRQADLDAGYF